VEELNRTMDQGFWKDEAQKTGEIDGLLIDHRRKNG